MTEIDVIMERVWVRIAIRLTHAEILMLHPYVEEVIDKCNCGGKKKPPKK